jgi:hypothetical protein
VLGQEIPCILRNQKLLLIAQELTTCLSPDVKLLLPNKIFEHLFINFIFVTVFASMLIGWKEAFEEFIIIIVIHYLCIGGSHLIPQLENWICRLNLWVSFFLFRKKKMMYFPIFCPVHHLSLLHFIFHIVFASAAGCLVLNMQNLYLCKHA